MTQPSRTGGRGRTRWMIAAGVAMLMLAGTMSALGTNPTDEFLAPDCLGPIVKVYGQGPSCRTNSGWRVFLRDGTSRTTHGPDPVPLDLPGLLSGDPGSEEGLDTHVGSSPICVANPASEYHNYVVYARAYDTPDNYAAQVANIRTHVKNANGWLREEALESSKWMDFKFRCAGAGDTTLTVANLALATPDASWSWDTIVADMGALGYNSVYAKYWVFYDDQLTGICGQGDTGDDDQPGVGNANNVGPDYAVAYTTNGNCWNWLTIMHEWGHSVGAVQNTAPDSDGAHHCTDNQDVMCYTGSVCSLDTNHKNFDCGKDSYFHAGTPTGWLATHWNLGSGNLRFTSKQSDCNTGLEAEDTGPTATPITLPQTLCPGTLNYEGDPDDYYKFPVTSGQVIKLSMTPNGAANFQLALKNPANTLKATSAVGGLGGLESITFTADSTGDWIARVYRAAGGAGNGDYTFSACKAC